jgi:hypothetical protein
MQWQKHVKTIPGELLDCLCQTHVGELKAETEEANFETADVSYQSQFLATPRYVTSSQPAER